MRSALRSAYLELKKQGETEEDVWDSAILTTKSLRKIGLDAGVVGGFMKSQKGEVSPVFWSEVRSATPSGKRFQYPVDRLHDTFMPILRNLEYYLTNVDLPMFKSKPEKPVKMKVDYVEE